MKHRHSVDDILISFCKMRHGSVELEEPQSVFKMSTFSSDTDPQSGGPLVNGITNRVDGESGGLPGPGHASERQHKVSLLAGHCLKYLPQFVVEWVQIRAARLWR
jgi:hypothetical protein